jgi:mannose-6-phosphate isomerase-like protein (cupin superfamily)
MKATVEELMLRLPGSEGERFAQAFAHGTMSVELYAPVGNDPQTPHKQDELYFIHAGTGELLIADTRHSFAPGMAFFVPAGVEHRFENFSEDFSTWVVFWGVLGGEQSGENFHKIESEKS